MCDSRPLTLSPGASPAGAHKLDALQEDLDTVRAQARQHPAVQALPDAFVSHNDILMAIAWVLSCDMRQRPRPGHAPLGGRSLGILTCDLVGNDVDGRISKQLLPPGMQLGPTTVMTAASKMSGHTRAHVGGCFAQIFQHLLSCLVAVPLHAAAPCMHASPVPLKGSSARSSAPAWSRLLLSTVCSLSHAARPSNSPLHAAASCIGPSCRPCHMRIRAIDWQ